MTDTSSEPPAHELVWLRELERRAIGGEAPNDREMMVKLRDSLPTGFRPESVNRRFLYGQGLSAEGLRTIGDSQNLLPDVERVIQFIRGRFIAEPLLAQITAAEVAEALSVSTARAESLLGLLASLSGNFFSGASGSPLGFTSVSFSDRSDVVAEYLAFASLDKLFEKQHDGPGLMKLAIPWLPESEPLATAIPNSVFILMSMDPKDDSLVDIHNAIREECASFDLSATRVDDIEYQDRITDLILERIQDSEFIVADLSGEKPNVYYEVGYAHALGKHPVLVRKRDTRLHFDLLVHNVPEYKNVTELREILRRRFEAILGRSPRP